MDHNLDHFAFLTKTGPHEATNALDERNLSFFVQQDNLHSTKEKSKIKQNLDKIENCKGGIQ